MGTGWRLATWVVIPGLMALGLWLAGVGRTLDGATLLGLGLGWAFLLAAVEVLAMLGRALVGEPVLPPDDARPADGRVEVASLAGARLERNTFDRRFGRVVALEGDAAIRARRGRALLGRVVVVAFFLERDGDGRGWSEEEIAAAHRMLVRSGEWIEREAIRYGAPVNLELAEGYVVARDPERRAAMELEFAAEGDRTRPVAVRETEELVASCSRASAALGLAADIGDLPGLIARLEGRAVADHIVWLLLPRASGQSLAILEEESGIPGVHLAVCYAQEADFAGPLGGPPNLDAVTLVHELLHLFGASDKYGVPLDAFPAGWVTRHEVMRLDEERLSRLRIDPLTAREVGWPARPEAQAETPEATARRTRRASRG